MARITWPLKKEECQQAFKSCTLFVISNVCGGRREIRRTAKDGSQYHEELERALRFLSPVDPRKRYQDIKSKRLDDTGTWVSNGANRDEKQQTAVNIIGTILRQLLTIHRDSSLGILAVHDTNLRKILICIDIDALDGCNEDERNQLFEQATGLLDCFGHSIRLFVTGRSYMEENIKSWIKLPTQTIHLEANSSDIRKYDENYSDMDDDLGRKLWIRLPQLRMEFVLDQETSLIRLVHKSLQDFLDSNKEKHDLFVNGHRDIARSCLTYISFLDSTTTSDPEKDRDVFCDIRYERQSPESSHIQKYPFITYAVHHWGHHATIQTDQEVTDLASALSPNNRTPQCISHKIRHSLFTATKTSGADVDLINKDGESPVQLAIQKSHMKIVRFLVDNGVDFQRSPLLTAVRQSNLEMVCLLLERGANIEAGDKMDITPLFFAVRSHIAMVRLLLEKGADIESRDIRGTTLLSRVAFGDGTDSEAIVNLLIERSADIEARDNEGLTPLAVAVKHRRLELLRTVHVFENKISSKRSRKPLNRERCRYRIKRQFRVDTTGICCQWVRFGCRIFIVGERCSSQLGRQPWLNTTIAYRINCRDNKGRIPLAILRLHIRELEETFKKGQETIGHHEWHKCKRERDLSPGVEQLLIKRGGTITYVRCPLPKRLVINKS
ncbi:Similar to Putative ankyrin repeat protein L93; acc. no. Q5UPG5 [Pyronema omphalodes CBS 100304]|uniref:Similar to Putative ankyrin repeat protein L93 acc. no. Q5UPG5 n=1 Tax=Pyronema omphalodes (strain CBS 100304) TaxID=1076935 RepID=U4LGJ9_PYROM|nr:Similar to Putative ankyrin repeat protein L93; acc. no. Q5UPG5 [Pyronema omphalodes CBS 100304]